MTKLELLSIIRNYRAYKSQLEKKQILYRKKLSYVYGQVGAGRSVIYKNFEGGQLESRNFHFFVSFPDHSENPSDVVRSVGKSAAKLKKNI